MNYRFLNCLLLVMVLATVAGCSGEHEEEHLEHFVPAHKPANLTSAVHELERRIPLVCGNSASPSATEQQELIDIVLWIPEFAADSDLRKADWEKAAAISAAMQTTLTPSLAPSTTQSDRQKIQEQLTPLVSDLKELLPRVSIDPHRQPGEPTGSAEPAATPESTAPADSPQPENATGPGR